MESLDRVQYEALEAEVKSKAIDRVSLGKFESEKIDKWIEQIRQFSKGFLSISRSDFICYLVRSYKDELSARELIQIAAGNYDPVRYINWLAPQIRKALSENDMIRVSELQEELRKIQLVRDEEGSRDQTRLASKSSDRSIKTKTKARAKFESDPLPATEENSEPGQGNETR